ncbi:hypothetical protein DMP15_23020 [Pseudonocardia sp. UM4_GMWB1]
MDLSGVELARTGLFTDSHAPRLPVRGSAPRRPAPPGERALFRRLTAPGSRGAPALRRTPSPARGPQPR